MPVKHLVDLRAEVRELADAADLFGLQSRCESSLMDVEMSEMLPFMPILSGG